MNEFIDIFADEDRIADLERKLAEANAQIHELKADNAYASRLVRRLIAAEDHIEVLEKDIEKLKSMVCTH